MRRSVRWMVILATLLWLVPVSGCRFAKVVTIQIPDFDSSQVAGVWMWRLSPDTNMYERSAELRITERGSADGVEYVRYSILDADGEPKVELPAEIRRDPANPDRVELTVFVMLFDGVGTFRASTYNDAGESPLSAEQLQISES